MKSLILKDLYNIGHNARSMICILLVFAFVLIPFSGVPGYIFVCAILCCMMIVTTFTFDDNSSWTRYAMVTPISRNDLVAGKFITLLIFCAAGTLFGLIIGTAGGIITNKVPLTPASLLQLFLISLTALVISMIFGSMSIPLVFRFGAEKGRMLLLISFLLPAAVCFIFYKLLTLAGVTLTDRLIFILICCSPLIALAWSCLMYKISCIIFNNQEL